jgi:hypothetical protein
MDVSNRNLVVGLAGIAILLISVLVYAQFDAAQNFELPELEQSAEVATEISR